MKIQIISLFLFGASPSFSQSPVSKIDVHSVDSGKAAFKLQATKDTADYTTAYRILNNQVKANPDNAEYRYFLGYTIDRMNAADANAMIYVKPALTLQASEQLEEVNRLQPIYKGEIIALDPYAKLSSIWGSLAQAYLYKQQQDSAAWALNEGKNRGGFIAAQLEYNRQLLNSCDSNAILLTSGDAITFGILYLQTIEKYRTDVSAVDVNMLGSYWYPAYIKKEAGLKTSLSNTEIDSLEYIPWEEQQIRVENPANNTQSFEWTLGPTYSNGYLLRSDRILLNFLQHNMFERPVFFCNNSDSTFNLYLTAHLINEGLVDRLCLNKQDSTALPTYVSKNLYLYNIDDLSKEDIVKSVDAISLLNGFRSAFLNTAHQLFEHGYEANAISLIRLMRERFPKQKLPYNTVEIETYLEEINKLVDKL
jgi:hypothetical protein